MDREKILEAISEISKLKAAKLAEEQNYSSEMEALAAIIAPAKKRLAEIESKKMATLQELEQQTAGIERTIRDLAGKQIEDIVTFFESAKRPRVIDIHLPRAVIKDRVYCGRQELRLFILQSGTDPSLGYLCSENKFGDGGREISLDLGGVSSRSFTLLCTCNRCHSNFFGNHGDVVEEEFYRSIRAACVEWGITALVLTDEGGCCRTYWRPLDNCPVKAIESGGHQAPLPIILA